MSKLFLTRIIICIQDTVPYGNISFLNLNRYRRTLLNVGLICLYWNQIIKWRSVCYFMMSVTLILDFVLPKSETEIFDQSLDSSPSSKNLSHFLLQPFKSLSRFALNINYTITNRYKSYCLQVKNQCLTISWLGQVPLRHRDPRWFPF